ncbi:MAG: hypothetical protein IKA70_03525 [Alistipes sp.]|nr:hypothetical protein [Alistipes sp.]
MKRFTLMLSALVALLATSCVKDATEDIQVSGAEGVVNFTVQAPEFGSRAEIGDGYKAQQLLYAVYDANWEYLTKGEASFNGGLTTSVSIRLVNNKEYNFVFWAQVPGNSYYTLDYDTATIAVSYASEANDEERDAFFGQLTGLVVNGTMNESVKLYRPFAQVNWGTNDVAEAKTGGFDVTKGAGATVVYEAEAYTELSLKDGAVDGLTAVTFTAEELVSNTYQKSGADEQLETKEHGKYHWIAMNYLLWTADQGTLTANKITITDAKNQQVVVSYPNANVRRNWRTNLVGSLLTDQTNIVVEILPGFDDQYDNGIPEYKNIVAGVDYDEETKSLYLTSLDGLKWFAQQTDGKTRAEVEVGTFDTKGGTFEGYTVKLVESIDLQGAAWTPIASGTKAFRGVFDGCGQTVSNFKVKTEGENPAGFFANARNVKNLKLSNVTIEGNYKVGAVVGDGLCSQIENCHVDNATITATVYAANKDYGQHVGGIVGYLSAERTACAKNCSVKNSTITGYRDIGGIAGTATGYTSSGIVITGNVVENTVVVANQLPEYYAEKDANVAAIVGRNIVSADLSNNTATDTQVECLKFVNNELALSTAVGVAALADYVNAGNDCAGKTITLEEDIDLSTAKNCGNSNTPIGKADSNTKIPFKGVFDGNGKTISNLYQSGWDFGYNWDTIVGYLGLFAMVEDATIQNVVLDGFTIEIEGGSLGAIAGYAKGQTTFKDITIKNSQLGSYNNRLGGVVGWTAGGAYTFENITIDEDVVLGGLWGSFDTSVGGVMGQLNTGASAVLKNVHVACRLDVYNDCTASYDYYNYRMCGMLVGQMSKTTVIDGVTYPDVAAYDLTCENVTVTYGDWMNYHYCRTAGARAKRVEPGFTYGGIAEDYDHSNCNLHHYECIPFDQLFGGTQYGCKGVKAWDGVTVNYPASYNPGN